MNRRQRERESLIALKTETQLAELAVSDLGEAAAEAGHSLTMFGHALRTANAASGGKLFASFRAEPDA